MKWSFATSFTTLILLTAMPLGACACIDDSNIHSLVKILLGLVYFIVLPFAVYALGGRLKTQVFYLFLLVVSVVAWSHNELFILFLPSVPFGFLAWYLKKFTHNKNSQQDAAKDAAPLL